MQALNKAIYSDENIIQQQQKKKKKKVIDLI